MAQNISWQRKKIMVDFIPFITFLIQDLGKILPNKEEFGYDIIKYRNNTKNKINNYLKTPLIQNEIIKFLTKNEIEFNDVNISYIHELIWDKLKFYTENIKLSKTIYSLEQGQINVNVILVKGQPFYYIGFQSKMLINLWSNILRENSTISSIAPMDYIMAHILNLDILFYYDILKQNNGIRKHNRRKTDLKGFNLESSYLFEKISEVENVLRQLESYVVMVKLLQDGSYDV